MRAAWRHEQDRPRRPSVVNRRFVDALATPARRDDRPRRPSVVNRRFVDALATPAR